MICDNCARIADLNRHLFNNGGNAAYPHPHNCGCACQHRKPQAWTKYFSVKEPDGETSTVTD